MIDVGLLASMAVMVIITSVFVRPWPPATSDSVADLALGPLVVGLVVGRLTAVAIDDPSSLLRVGDLVIIRSGVEFWPAVVAGIAWLAVGARREGASPVRRLASLSAPALVAWACYEATCLLRDGCPGPVSAVGLRPRGLIETMLPIGLFVAALAIVAALVLRAMHRRGTPDVQVVVLTLGSIAAIRAGASWWLPRIGDGVTRQHRTSIAVLAVSIVAYVVSRSRSRSRSQPSSSDRRAISTSTSASTS